MTQIRNFQILSNQIIKDFQGDCKLILSNKTPAKPFSKGRKKSLKPYYVDINIFRAITRFYDFHSFSTFS